ncbi:DUF924 family protein [Vibrio marisflavi]|uniref:DUF924 domain-containing protein n=1 Tax=Vibrio marisflavi CECT 7928 TaxID=634439 RepID=A0ABM9A0F9_9VIBR|nr:DUF924 family protein [Vibrio marisflavi]CAH0536367.1 hypothetical protein VMF7928_00380 [Vibrio marisflavi CECT 7928]
MYENVLNFWFNELKPNQWFANENDLDDLIRTRFSSLLSQAGKCELFEWRKTARGRLAEIIVLDQFSRNIYRGQSQSFSQDPLALALAQEAVALGADLELNPTERTFLYMPFMHSESPHIHEEAMRLFEKLGNQTNLDFEVKHKIIIDRFGRYPHRNEILSRTSTEEEIEFLKQPDSGF